MLLLRLLEVEEDDCRAAAAGDALRSNIHTTSLFSMPEKDLACPSMQYVKCNVPEVPGCSTSSGQILQYASQRAFLAILTHNPLQSRKYITHVTLCHSDTNKAETDDR